MRAADKRSSGYDYLHPKPVLTERRCLRCARPFPSRGAGNRLCVKCSSECSDVSALAPDHWPARWITTSSKRHGRA